MKTMHSNNNYGKQGISMVWPLILTFCRDSLGRSKSKEMKGEKWIVAAILVQAIFSKKAKK